MTRIKEAKARLTHWYIVLPEHMMGPAVKSSTPSGIRDVYRAGLAMYCWYVPNNSLSLGLEKYARQWSTHHSPSTPSQLPWDSTSPEGPSNAHS